MAKAMKAPVRPVDAEYLTIQEIMARWRISRSTAHRLLAAGTLPYLRVGRRRLVAGAAVAAYEAAQGVQ